MKRVIVSTVGTSLLTNQINRNLPVEQSWFSLLSRSANLNKEDIQQETIEIIEKLEGRAREVLLKNNVKEIRRASAELNGIYGLYNNDLDRRQEDFHWLIATDTFQGREAAEILKWFLSSKNIAADTYEPGGLSTSNTKAFAIGIDVLLKWFEEALPGYRDQKYCICFNLVGSFKSLQGYMNTIGMFYADEIIYIFEGEGSELITIPRLPIQVDDSIIEPYAVGFALMAEGEASTEQVLGVQESLILRVDSQATLSTWGSLVWNRCKGKFLSGKLLDFPRLKYETSFLKDYDSIKDDGDRVKLQETLAKASSLLERNKGDIYSLKGNGSLLYSHYETTKKIDHFRVTRSLRISCAYEDGKLVLLNYGTHKHVEGQVSVHDKSFN